jgi:hypothetical protein
MIALMTRSILPGILFHAANNSFAIWMGTAGINLNRLDWSAYVTGFAVFGLSLYMIWRYGKESGDLASETRGRPLRGLRE